MNVIRAAVMRNLVHPSRLLNASRQVWDLRQHQDTVPSWPTMADIEPTVKCNLHCGTCQVSTWTRNVPNLSLANFQRILDRLPTLMKIKLHGMGEPLLSPDFCGMVRLAVARQITVVTVSNGTLLSDRMCGNLVASGLSRIHISVDGATKQTFERLRAGARYETVIVGIRRLLRARQGSGLGVHLWMTGQRDNIHELPDLVRLAADLKVDSLAVQHDLVDWGQVEWQGKNAPRALDSTQDDLIADAQALATELGVRFEVFRGGKFTRDHLCWWPWSSVYVSAEGDIVPCGVMGNPETMRLGNLLDESFESIWNGPAYQAFRHAMREGEMPSACRGCYGMPPAAVPARMMIGSHAEIVPA